MSKEVSPETLEATPARVLPFLRAIGTNGEIRSTMFGCGYTEEEQAHGWKMLLEVSGYNDAIPPTTDDQKARAAITELDAWDDAGFRRIRAALSRLHPEQDSFLFSGIEAGTGSGSIVAVAMFLDRMDTLESSTNEPDKAAIATLTKRGIDTALRAKLRELVNVAQSAKPVVSAPPPNPGERQAKLMELHAWFSDWSETARAVIRRRDQLILMGLGKRKSKKSEVEPVTPPVVPPSNGSSPTPVIV